MGTMTIRDVPPSSVQTWMELDKYKTLYDDITRNGIELLFHHRHALGELACMLVEMELLRKSLLEEGEWAQVNGDKGNQVRKRNPARDALDKLRTQSFRLMKEFKMTPASQSRTNPTADVPNSGSSNDDGYEDI